MAMSPVSAQSLESPTREKLQRCRGILHDLGSVAVAFSGGVDSSLLLALSAETLGRDNVLAAMAVSTIFPQAERRTGQRFAGRLAVELVELATPQLADPNFTANPADRCYYCKNLLLGRLKALAAERGLAAVVTGSQASDSGDYRPGLRAEEQQGIRRPLLEADMMKDEVRAVSRAMGLPGWDRPSGACLATRIPYNQPITAEKLARVESAEEILHELGFVQCRVRDHAPVARIEVPPEAIRQAADMRDRIARAIADLGYTYVALDLEGFRSGSMNKALT
jgi:uncharacterized protein